MIQELSISNAQHMADLHAQGFDNPWPHSDFENHINNPLDTIFGFFEQEVLRGFIIIRAQQDQAEILTIVMGKKSQGKGFAKELLQSAEQNIVGLGVEILFLEVAKDNTSAIKLYQNSGYQNCGTRPGYYRRSHGRVDALLFQKHLAKKIFRMRITCAHEKQSLS